MPSTQFFVPVVGIDEAVHQNVEAGGAEAVEFNHVEVLTHTRVGLDDGPDPFDERLHLICCGVVADPERGLIPTPTTLTHVVDPGVRQIAVGHADERVIEGTHAGRPKADGLDRAFDAINNNPVTDLEWFVSKDGDSAQQVADRVLCSQRDSKTTETQASNQ